MSERFDMASRVRLEVELIELGRSLAYPVPSGGFAPAVTEALARRSERRPWWRGQSRLFGRPVRRAVLVAIALALAAAAVAGAVGLGLPGLRIIFGQPGGPSPSPTVTAAPPTSGVAPGSTLGLGASVPLDQLDQQAGAHLLLPGDPAVGPPDVAYLDRAKENQVSLVWATRPGLPPTLDPGVGLLLTQFNGRLDNGFFSKAIGGNTIVEPVKVHGAPAFWISGAPHFFFYTGRDGQMVVENRRWVGDALLWSDGTFTYRLETSLGREAAIRIAESLR